MSFPHRRGEWVACSKLNRAIHEKIFAIAGNAALTQLYQTLMVRIHAVRFVARRSAARWRQAVEDHERLMAGLRARAGVAVAAVLREHLGHKADRDPSDASFHPPPGDQWHPWWRIRDGGCHRVCARHSQGGVNCPAHMPRFVARAITSCGM